jgi:hypothetical protein
MAFTVYSWGYGDSMANALQGVAMLFGHDGSFYGVAKVAALFGFIAVLLGYFSARAMADPLRIVKFYVVLIGVASVFFGITTTVQVHDKALNQTYVVQRVPYPVAYVLSFMTQVEDAIARQVDSAFGIGVQHCGSQNMGIFACSQIMAQASDMRVVDPYLYLNLTNFFQDCVFTNILDGSLDAYQLETSTNLYGVIFSNLHPARFTVLYGQGQCTYPCTAPCGGGCSMSCVDAGAYLSSTLYQWVNTQGLNALSAAVGQTVLADLLNTVPSNVMRVSQTGTGFLMQAVLMNQFKETYSSWAASQGMGLTEQGLFTKGQIEKATANRYLPLINGILHVLFASLVPVLVIFMLTPLMGGALMLALTFGLWMIVWKFAEAVVNGFFYSKLVGNFYNFAQQQGWDFNVLNAPVISTLLVDHISLGGSLYWLVPTVSFMVASLGGYAFHSFATGLGGVVQGTAQASAGDVARGSFNAGQVNYRNVSAGTTSLGSFSGWDTRGFNTSFLQEQKGNIISQGGRVEGKGLSVDNALRLAAIRGDDFTKNVIAEMSAIAGQGASASMVINPQGRLEHAEMVSGDGGFRVVYDGRGRLAVMKGGVEHGSIELDEKGEIKGFETNVQLGNMTAEYVKGRANEYRELASAYGQVANTLKNLFSENRSAKDFENFRKALSKIGERNFSAILEVAKALGLDKTIAEELVKLYGDKYSEEYRNRNATEFGIKGGARGEFSAKLGVGEGGGLLPIKLSGGATGYLDISTGRIYTDEDVKAMSAYMSNEERNQLVEKLTRSLQDKLGKSSSSSQSKRTDTAYTQGKEYSEGVDQSKVYEVAENFSKKAEEMHARADSLQVSLKQDPLHYYAQQKYKEALRAGKSKGEAVRYAMEEVAKLRSNPEALEKWLNEFAKEQGIQPPNVNKEELNNIPNEVPRQEDIKKEGEELRRKVAGRIDNTREKISEERKKLERYQPPTVSPQLSEDMFRLKEDEFRLNLGRKPQNDPRFTPYANKAKEWYKNQPNPLRRVFNDVIDLGNAAGQHVVNFGEKFINFFPDSKGNKSNMPPLQGMP